MRRRREEEKEKEQIRGYSPTLATVPRQTLLDCPRSGHFPGRGVSCPHLRTALEGAGRPPSCLLPAPVGQSVPWGSSSPSRLVARSPLLGKPGQLRAQPGPEQVRHLPRQKATWAAVAAGLYPEGEIPALSTRGQDEQCGRCSWPRIWTQDRD